MMLKLMMTMTMMMLTTMTMMVILMMQHQRQVRQFVNGRATTWGARPPRWQAALRGPGKFLEPGIEHSAFAQRRQADAARERGGAGRARRGKNYHRLRRTFPPPLLHRQERMRQPPRNVLPRAADLHRELRARRSRHMARRERTENSMIACTRVIATAHI